MDIKNFISTQGRFFDLILPTWTNDTKSDYCRWEGIKCNRTSRRIIGLSVGQWKRILETSESNDVLRFNLSLLHPFEEIQSLNLSGNSYCHNFDAFFDDVEGYRSLSKLRNLQTLDLSFDWFNDSVLPFLNSATSLTTLILRSTYNLESTFLFKELKNLTKLEVLDVRENQLGGSLSGVCEMKNLRELILMLNNFEGQVPSCLGSLKKLRVLDLSSNQLSGRLPLSFRSLESLEYLSLLENNFTGLFSLNPLTNLTKLKVLKLSSTNNMKLRESTCEPEFQLSVVVLQSCNLENIPFFLKYQTDLRLVDLSSNRLSGEIPTWLERNPELEVLKLESNSFTVFEMPTMLHHLKVLVFSANKIRGWFPDNIGRAVPELVLMNGSDNGFQGKFPSSIGEMKNISLLDMSFNSFSGQLPSRFLASCFSLKYLKLSHNNFSGRFLPRETRFTSLEVMRMDHNSFSGKIGVDLSSSTMLSLLDISSNHLSGDLPSWVSKLSNLKSLLSNNFLEGTIPPSLQLLPSLAFLDLSGNMFSGALPSHVMSESRRSWMIYMRTCLILNNNNFTGPVPGTLLRNVNMLDLRNNKLSGRIPQFVDTQNISILLMSGNRLSGSIPRQLCEMKGISLLDLSDNKLNGSLPSCMYDLSFKLCQEYDQFVWNGGGFEGPHIYRSEFYKSTTMVEKLEEDTYISQEFGVEFKRKE